MNPKTQKTIFPSYRVKTVLSKYITIGEVYTTTDFDDACAQAVVFETKYCRLTEDYDVKVVIEVIG